MILGHSHPEVVKRIEERAENGTLFGAPIEEEVKFGELIKRSSGLDRIRIVNTGTEATLHALRLSIFHTKRKKILKIKGGYHGTHVYNYPSESVDEIDFNSAERAKESLEKKEYAAIIMEPIMGNAGVIMPKEGYLEEVQDLAHKAGTLFIMDEVITGYRTSFSPYYKTHKLKPDLVTFGKIVGGGLPLAIYGGSENIMNEVKPEGAFQQAGTYSANPLSVAAGLETLNLLKKKDYSRLKHMTEVSARELNKAGVTVNSATGMLSFFFTEKEVNDLGDVNSSKHDLYLKFFRSMLDAGIYLPAAYDESLFISFAHTEKQVRDSFSKMAEEVERIWKGK